MAKNIKLEDILNDLQLKKTDQDGINTVAVIGLGIMGQGIAHTIAAAGIEVIAIERNEERLTFGLNSLKESIDHEIQRWTLTKSDKNAIVSRIHPTVDLTQAKNCDIVIEAVDEDLELKKSIFEKLDGLSAILRPFSSQTRPHSACQSWQCQSNARTNSSGSTS